MKQTRNRDIARQWSAFVLTLTMMLPLLLAASPAAHAQFGQPSQNPPRKGMSTGQKVLLVGGAALLYYLYRKNQAKKEELAAAQQRPVGGGTYNPPARQAAMPQLYQSKNGGIYYRDAQNRPVWLTVPNRPVQVSAQDLNRYAPDYNRYQGPAPSAPRGYRTQPFEDFDRNAYGGGSAVPPGPGTNGGNRY